MDKILVPVDFSVPSNWGFNYAYDLAASIGAEIIVVHMYLPSSEATFSLEKLQADAPRRKQELLDHLKAATQRFDSDKGVKISYDLDYADKNDIAHYAKKHEANLIVMGTHGAGNAFEKAWGSSTSEVIKNAHCPVLAVPEGTVFNTALDIAYATNFSSDDLQSITQLVAIAVATKSKLHCVHINLVTGGLSTEESELFVTELGKRFGNLPVTFTSWSANNVEDGLEIFCKMKNIDILAMLTRDKTAWSKLFGPKSVTKSMAFRNILPLLAFHQ